PGATRMEVEKHTPAISGNPLFSGTPSGTSKKRSQNPWRVSQPEGSPYKTENVAMDGRRRRGVSQPVLPVHEESANHRYRNQDPLRSKFGQVIAQMSNEDKFLEAWNKTQSAGSSS